MQISNEKNSPQTKNDLFTLRYGYVETWNEMNINVFNLSYLLVDAWRSTC